MARTLFAMPKRNSKNDDKQLLNNKRKPAPTVVKGGGNSISSKVAMAKKLSEKYFSHLLPKLDCIRNRELLHEYIDKCIENGIVALDTETDGLDRVGGKIAGVCLYTPGMKGVYCPIGHISHMTLNLVKDQIPVEDMKYELERMVEAKVKFVFHNAKFDMHVCYWNLGVYIEPYWDTNIAGNLLNENEPHSLKVLWNKYCSPNPESAEVAKFNTLFKGIIFNMIPIDVAYLYASFDPIMTYELYEFQKQFLDEHSQLCIDRGLVRVAQLFKNKEMPLIPAVFDMEKTGIKLDMDLANELHNKYSKILDEALNTAHAEIKKVQQQIDELSVTKPNLYKKLDHPINIGSTTQLAILLYDVLGLQNKEGSRGTGEEILKSLNHPICEAVLAYRSVSKLMSTYIDALPQQIQKRTGKIHANFNQYGAKTGRFSSSDPNLQNIPSHNKEIRKMFIPDEGHVLVGADYSQQEPRCLAHMSGDENMINAYLEGKDLYATIASTLYNMPYEECLEFRPSDHSLNPEGKERRSSVKSVLLGIMYGRGSSSIAEQMNISKKEAEQIISNFFKTFPKVADFVMNTQANATNYGFVETAWGRKRRLPDMMLDKYELIPVQTDTSSNFNPLFDDEDDEFDENYVPDEVYSKYYALMDKAWGKAKKEAVKKQALQEGYKLIDNGGKIADAQRQCVNSVIQGSSADITKTALINIYRDEELNRLGFKSLLTVHDEIIGQCPEENVKAVAKRLADVMINSAKEKISVPMKCDVEVTRCWYGDSIEI